MWANSFLFALPQLFIIHQRSGFIIQYSFVPMYHSVCLPAIPFHTFIAAKSPPCLKGGVGGDSVSLSRQHRADGNVCGRSQNAPTGCKDRMVLIIKECNPKGFPF